MENVFTKDPGAELDFAFDWNDASGPPWLETDETITSFTVTASAGLTVKSSSQSVGKVTVWLTGGTAGVTYSVVCKIVTSKARKDERTIWVNVLER